ncbi:MAG: ATP-binding cassette domain-containing protein [Spirochaetaceae bacterium]|nr:MAG: ATP-binding cassette domain-containing protein [Spirochaetaceae bacterium]
MAKPDDSREPRITERIGTSFRFLIGFLQPHLRLFVGGLVLLLLSNAVFLAFPYLTGQIINELSGGDPWIIRGVGTLSVLLLIVLTVRAVFNFGQIWLFGAVSNRLARDIRRRLYGHLLQLPISYYDSHRTGELLSRLSNDVTQLETAISDVLAGLVRQVLVVVFGIAIAVFLAPQLALFMVLIVPPVALGARRLGRIIRDRARETQDLLAESSTIAEETIAGVATVKSFANEGFESDRYNEALHRVLGKAMETVTLRALIGSSIGLLVMGSLILVIWFGATLVDAGTLAVGDLISFVIYTGFIGGSVAGLGNSITRIQRVLGSSERVIELMQMDPEPGLGAARPFHSQAEDAATATRQQNTPETQPALPPLADAVALRSVSFAYPTRPDLVVLKNLDLTIPRNSRVALVGPSGSGKSTIVRLLLRFYELNEGAILRDGTDITSFDLRAYRSCFAIVPQDVLLFGGSVEENIRYGRPDATAGEVRAAAEAAHMTEFVDRFPEGLSTIVGERGVQLSGGQRQRVAIARAMLRDPEFLILDEATSSLDAESEWLVQDALDRLMEHRTTLVIAHRLATVRKADSIVVLDQGSIVEQGTHEELTQIPDGLYAKLVRMQGLGDTVAAASSI